MLSPNFPLNLSPKTSESCMSYPKCRKCMHQMNELCDEHSLLLPERWSRLVISRTCKTPRFPHIPTSSSSEPVASQYALPWLVQTGDNDRIPDLPETFYWWNEKNGVSTLKQAHFLSTQGSERQRFLWQVLRAALVPAAREKASVDLCRGVV